ncbi:CPBP family intramembrane metalloprotease [Streptomyces sp. CHD11]|uniref:CPBP family intramembrane glutamic endopeptidase n=1 Tax=Streptomyces sp. CHD11 TaxID=2741325 RepID=UPI001BFC12A7|nr:CPBP family intramembrane glutamic endopeptidase [Streptomyces sp. CHD11]MBT3150109.1 CPBP family intramembrane metalloprotease [Streptomyces sp. CHD11]
MGTASVTPHDTGSGPEGDREGLGGRWGRIARSPLGWMLTGMVGVGLVSGLTATGPGPVPVLGAVAAVAVYWLVMRHAAQRSTPEIARLGAGREVLLGGGIGLGFILVSVLLITAFGGYSFSWAGDGFMSVVWTAVAVQVGAAVTEELLFRGLALQALEKLWGSWAAIVITSLFFGVAHLGAPAANAWSGVAIALEAGVLLGAAFLWRRNIWFVVGLHFAWNLTQQLLGIPVSGHAPEGLFTVDVHGSALLTGGGFGLEASIMPVLIGVAIAVVMLVRAHRDGGIKARRSANR